MADAATEKSLNAFCLLVAQRRELLSSREPPVRFDLTSPYVSFTQRQLDMRRKAEILKYSSNKVPTQTNKLTKKQRYAQVMKSSFGSVPRSVLRPNISGDLNGYAVCPSDASIPQPTTSSGIPGKLEYLFEDSTIPLYNYSRNNVIYPSDSIRVDAYWVVIAEPDVLCKHNISTEFMRLTINTTIDQPMYMFQLITPIAIYATGNINANHVNKTLPITVSITYAAFEVYYGGVLSSSTRLFNQFPTMVFDVSGNTGRFTTTQYLGNLVINNIKLYTEPGYNYTMKLLFRMSITGGGPNYFSTITSGVSENITSSNLIVNNSHLISIPESISTNNGFSLTGS